MIKAEPFTKNYIDLRGTPCPVNYVRCSLALESLNENEFLKIDLDKGEPYEMVISGLKKEGHEIQIIFEDTNWVRLLVICCARV